LRQAPDATHRSGPLAAWTLRTGMASTVLAAELPSDA
jgi:hypothetical protein